MTQTSPDPDPATEPVVARPAERTPSRLLQALAWVGIAAGSIFIVAMVFGAGFFLGAHSDGGGHHHRGGHDRGGMMMHHPGGMGGPGGMEHGRGMMPPWGPGGPGSGSDRPETPPTPAPPARP
ncbi:hypothetical protein [Mycolicibacterium alvei]|nr:hypothetical protein [Mycolicibacterium alvei]